MNMADKYFLTTDPKAAHLLYAQKGIFHDQHNGLELIVFEDRSFLIHGRGKHQISTFDKVISLPDIGQLFPRFNAFLAANVN